MERKLTKRHEEKDRGGFHENEPKVSSLAAVPHSGMRKMCDEEDVCVRVSFAQDPGVSFY